ncbi:hypothetical protein B0H16DRAFT_1577373 [Mycena metata]|uniref:F-box domain-containing protein n=1 Tax=Mycena metata TaxID=1033252 RepID=A0AAD7I4A1_9AGAR|nr:hypothetical protein B0H16DRAFT_1577373 [Mycena metata]
MIVTRQPHTGMEIFQRLPNEVIAEIIGVASKVNQATLCRVSKLFNDLCLPTLYRVVLLEDYAAALAFTSTLLANTTRAATIRSFTVERLYEPWPQPSPPVLGGMLLASMKLMTRLEHLFFPALYKLQDNCFDALLADVTLPCLLTCGISHFSSWNAAGDKIGLFLQRHPTLTRVRLRTNMRIVISPTLRISLPNLRHYDGSVGLLPSMEAGGNLTRARLHWHSDHEDEDIDQAVKVLCSLSNPTIPFFAVHEYRDNSWQPILTSMAAHMPHTTALQMRPLAEFGTDLTEQIIDHITACLPVFTKLVYLAFECEAAAFPSSDADEDDDCNTVETWSEACPTLEACCFNSCAWRKGEDGWEEFDMSEFRALVGIPDSGYW